VEPSEQERRREIEAIFVPENELPDPVEVLSPSGRFRLLIRGYRTRPGCWSYSRGTVIRVADGAEVCDIKRNYCTFHHSFVLRRGEEWLLAGRSYMSQTIVNLETGVEHEPAGKAYDGAAFCWAKGFISPDGQTLVVDGCQWACPYEYRFFDFADPARGWPALPIDPEATVEIVGERPPIWIDERTCECCETSGDKDDELCARTRLRRDGGRMLVVERWVSDDEQRRRAEAERAEAAVEAWRTRYCGEDPLYLQMRRLATEHALPDDGFVAWGRREQELVVTKHFRRGEPRASADLLWGAERGPITVRLYDERGMHFKDVEHERGERGMQLAIELIAARFAASEPGAAHSMDTSWFAVDDEGHVAVFDSGEAGAVPEVFLETHGHQYDTDELHELLLEGDPRPIYDVSDLCVVDDGQLLVADWESGTRGAKPFDADPLRDTTEWLVWLRNERRLENLPDLRRLPTADGKVIAHGLLQRRQLRALRQAHAICRAWCHARPELDRWGVYCYSHGDRYENWISGPYSRDRAPRTPLRLDAIAPEARRIVETVRFEGLRFAQAARIQPVEHHACSSWQHSFVSCAGDDQIALPEGPARFSSVPGVHPVLGAAQLAAEALGEPRRPRHLGGPAPALTAPDKLELLRWICRALEPAAQPRERMQMERVLKAIADDPQRAAQHPPEGRERRRLMQLERLASGDTGESHLVAVARHAAGAAADIIAARDAEITPRVREATRLAVGVVGGGAIPDLTVEGFLAALDGELLRRELQRAAEERAGARPAVRRVLWRGLRDGAACAWIARLEATGDDRYGVLIELGGEWTWSVGDRDDVCAHVPEAMFAEAAEAVVRAEAVMQISAS
jgi:hypothetical protein